MGSLFYAQKKAASKGCFYDGKKSETAGTSKHLIGYGLSFGLFGKNFGHHERTGSRLA
jgi:hypothetical protein